MPLSPENRKFVIIGGALLVAGWLFTVVQVSDRQTSPRAGSSPVARSVEADEPCVADGNTAEARAAAQNWCGGGVFTQVHLASGQDTVAANFQLSTHSHRVWPQLKPKVLAQFRPLATRMAEEMGMNVVFSFHDPEGQLIAGCTRRATDAQTVCR